MTELLTVGLEDGAKMVRLHPVTLAERARAGKIPGASKPGKEWVFLVEGLLSYLNANSPCPFTGEAVSGGSRSPRSEAELENLLGLPTRNRRGSTTRNAKVRYGVRTG